MRGLALLIIAAAAASTAAAAEPPAYLDDRSTPETILRSYYNAVTRGELARAWSYFGDQKPSDDYAAWAKGYEGTVIDDLAIGSTRTEGAAGSVYGTVPVAIAVTGPDGSRVFAGCYTTRQIQPAIQEPPFRPLKIEAGKLHAASLPLVPGLPTDCAP